MLRPVCLFPALILIVACASGGEEDRPQSEVTIAANHHALWFRSLPGFGTFPVQPATVFAGHGLFALSEDSSYELSISSGASGGDRYALANNGALSVFFTGSGREPSTVFRGAYRLVGAQPDLFFTDRVSSGSSTSIGVYYGTRVIVGQAELAGAWHLLSLHTIFATQPVLTSPDNVGRAAHGGITIATGDPGTVRALSGAGRESGGHDLTFGGTIQNLLQNGTGDGTCNLTVSYLGNTTTADSRTFFAVAGLDIVMALDDNVTDGESGMLFLVRKFDAPANPADSARIAGNYLFGGHTLFVNPTNSGSDAFVGRLQLTAQGGFRLDAEDHRGADFSYTGTWTATADGAVSLQVAGTNETWFAAINRTYDTLVLVDNVVETRVNNIPELNLGIGVREKTD